MQRTHGIEHEFWDSERTKKGIELFNNRGTEELPHPDLPKQNFRLLILSKEIFMANKELFKPVDSIIIFKNIESSEECIEFAKYLLPNCKLRIFYDRNIKNIVRDLYDFPNCTIRLRNCMRCDFFDRDLDYC